MNQPLLHIITEHSLDFSNKEMWIDRIKNQPIQSELEQYLFYASHLTNAPPEEIQPIELRQLSDDGEINFSLNHIDIKIRKHIIHFCFPLVFRAFCDYTPLREAIEQLLGRWFSPFGVEEYVAYPSFWKQSFTEIRNAQHEKRLAVLQNKICCQCVSYKRTKLNLELCLSTPAQKAESMKDKQYRGWFVNSLFNGQWTVDNEQHQKSKT